MAIREILLVRKVSKSFPGVQALDQVDFDLHASEIHALVGQNGAGKSTLMKILVGNYRKDGGEIVLNGRNEEISSPREAAERGIALVRQELSLANFRTVAENVFLGREPKGRLGLIDRDKMNHDTGVLLEQLKASSVRPESKVQDLSVAQRQIVEIAKALSLKPSILVLDEPTSSLTLKETEDLLNILRALKSQGLGIVFITHRLKEIFQCCDRITVLRDGRRVDTLSIHETDERSVVSLMIGRNLESYFLREKGAKLPGHPVLAVQGLRVPGRLEQIDFTLQRGEILGITGLLGSGHELIPRCLFGLQRAEVALKRNGHPVKIRSPRDALKAGIGLLTENRREEGLYLRASVLKNTTLLILHSVAIRVAGWIQRRKENLRAEEYVKLMNIMTPSLNQMIRYLSGGNQQKVIIARWLLRDPDVLMFIEPTRGIDIGSKSEIYQYLHRIAREREKGIIVVSTELAEVVGISDRILAMYNGRIVEEIRGEEATEEQLMKRITGG